LGIIPFCEAGFLRELQIRVRWVYIIVVLNSRSMKKLNVAVVGVGSMGKNHVRIFSELKKVNLIAVCDINGKNAREISRMYKTKYYSNHKQLIKKEKLNAVSIAVPTELHESVALDFIENNIPVLVEKPLASNVKSAKRLIMKAKKERTLLTVGHVERFNPVVMKLHELIKNGKFGDILSIVIRRVGLFPLNFKDVGVVTDLGVHDLDIVTSLLGKNPEKIFARGGNAFTKKYYDHAEIFLDFGKIGCFILTNWVTPVKIRKLSVTGTKGHAELDFITQKLEVFKSNFKLKQVKGFSKFVKEFGEPKKYEIKINSQEPLKLEMENFVNAITGSEKLKVKPEEALNAIYLSELVNKSINIRKIVKIK